MKRWLCSCILMVVLPSSSRAGFLGLADVEYVPYEGPQRWETAPGAMVDRRYKLPVYHGRPPRPYIVLGAVTVSGAGGFTKVESAMRDAIREARKHGADAVILLGRGTDSSGLSFVPNGSGGFSAYTNTRGRAQVFAIKWR